MAHASTKSWMSMITIIVIIISSAFPQLAIATCYWQNSTRAVDSPYVIAPDDTPCFPNQENSPCCGTGWTCLSDGVCKINLENQDYYYRGTCTDRTWNSQQCPGWCFNKDSNTSIPIGKCQKPNGEDWYCCPDDPNCDCESGKFAIKLGTTQPTTVTVIGSTSWPGMSSTTTPFTASPLFNTATNTANPTIDITINSNSGSGLPAQTSSASSDTNLNATTSSNSTKLAAGLGAGLGGALLIAIIAGAILFHRNRQHQAQAQAQAQAQNLPYHQNYQGYSPYSQTSTQYSSTQPSSKHSDQHFMPGHGFYATRVVNEKASNSVYEKGGGDTHSHPHVDDTQTDLDFNFNGELRSAQDRVELAG